MPGRTPVDPQLVLSTFLNCEAGRETARVLGIHENTVYSVMKRFRGDCVRCGSSVPAGRKVCDPCNEKLGVRAKARRKEKIRLGLCVQCLLAVDPPSRMFCRKHRLMAGERNRRHHAKKVALRGTPGGVPNDRQRERHILDKYGMAAVDVWREKQGRCELCHVQHQEKAVVIHHIDGDPCNNSRDNFACLCMNCHKLTYLLIEHPSPAAALAWLRTTYPRISFS